MFADRYLKTVLTVIAVALVALTIHAWLPESGVREALRPAAAVAQDNGPEYVVSIPKSWGKLVSFSNNNLLLESSDGSLRIVDVEGKPPKFPKVKVLMHWQ
jgi:hypothetical protein